MDGIPYIQSVVASIARVAIRGGIGIVEQLHGTGFFISKSGHLLTARHVIEKGRVDCEQNDGFLAFFPKAADGTSSRCLPLETVEFAPEPFDVALCQVQAESQSFYRLCTAEVAPWQEVASVGYPMTIVTQTSATYRVHTRFHRGYIQRLVAEGDLIIGPNPPAFEVSFPVTQGMSGAPLFIYRPDGDLLIGVCVGSVQSSVVAYEDTQIESQGTKYVERVSRIEEIGIAHNISALASWQPKILGGATLAELSERCWVAI